MLQRDIENYFVKRKCLHVKLLKDTHSQLRIECFKRQITMQDIFEEVASRIIRQDPDMFEMLDEIAHDKHNKKVKQLLETDAKTIFDAIDDNSPITGGD
jgi:hypothetical protein